ncbi:MAG: MFS transporter, partial [Caldilineaceae bacterium]
EQSGATPLPTFATTPDAPSAAAPGPSGTEVRHKGAHTVLPVGATRGAPAAAEPRRSTFAALRHRNFRLYAFGMLVSMAGSWMQAVAQGWLVYELSRSERTLGVVAFAAAIPALIISPWAGVLLDRVSKRSVLLVTQVAAMCFALVLATLAFTGAVQVWHIVALAVGLGVVNAFDGPARQAFVVEMVGREDLSNAIALNSMIFNGARVIGPALSGILLALVGAAWCFLINGLSFLAVIAALLAMNVPPYVRTVRVDTPWTQLKAGLIYVRRRSDLTGLLTQAFIFSVFGISYSTILPAYASENLGVGAGGFALLSAVAGLGAVTAAYGVARFGDRAPRGIWLTTVALIFPVLLALFAWANSLAVALPIIYFMGVGFLSQFVLINVLIQGRVDDAMRGRVLSLYTLTFFGFAPFGNLALGAAAEHWSISIALTLAATITLGLTAVNLLRSPAVRTLR